jgi:hypothetical protein
LGELDVSVRVPRNSPATAGFESSKVNSARKTKETWMNRPILVCTFFVTAAAALGAQQTSQTNPYEGTSRPPADDQIITSQPVEPVQAPTPPPAQVIQPSAPSVSMGAANDDGIVHVAPPSQETMAPEMTQRAWANDPDGDIVHPRPRRPGELDEGTTIRVRLLERLSSGSSEQGEEFRTTVATDVLQGGRVVIPAGAEISGRLMQVSTGHLGGRGSMRLAPETVTMPNGVRYRLSAELSGAPGSRSRVGGEGIVRPGSQLKRDGIEYGGAVGVGLVAGAIIGGPAGAAAGGLIGAGVITVHLLVNHPQATLDRGTTLMLTLTEPLDLVPNTSAGN